MRRAGCLALIAATLAWATPALAQVSLVGDALVQPSLGRPLSGGAANVTVNLLPSGTLYVDRVNQVDLRVGKILRTGGVRASLNLDVFNAFNAAPVLGVNSAFGGTTPWLRPQAILQARLLKVSWTVDF